MGQAPAEGQLAEVDLRRPVRARPAPPELDLAGTVRPGDVEPVGAESAGSSPRGAPGRPPAPPARARVRSPLPGRAPPPPAPGGRSATAWRNPAMAWKRASGRLARARQSSSSIAGETGSLAGRGGSAFRCNVARTSRSGAAKGARPGEHVVEQHPQAVDGGRLAARPRPGPAAPGPLRARPSSGQAMYGPRAWYRGGPGRAEERTAPAAGRPSPVQLQLDGRGAQPDEPAHLARFGGEPLPPAGRSAPAPAPGAAGRDVARSCARRRIVLGSRANLRAQLGSCASVMRGGRRRRSEGHRAPTGPALVKCGSEDMTKHFPGADNLAAFRAPRRDPPPDGAAHGGRPAAPLPAEHSRAPTFPALQRGPSAGRHAPSVRVWEVFCQCRCGALPHSKSTAAARPAPGARRAAMTGKARHMILPISDQAVTDDLSRMTVSELASACQREAHRFLRGEPPRDVSGSSSPARRVRARGSPGRPSSPSSGASC